MKISYLPEVVSPTGATVFPISTGGVAKKVQLSTLNNFSGSGTVGNVFAGQNVKLSQSPATTASVISFAFPGAIFPYPSPDIPNGWLLCNGQAVSRQTYASLFDVVGVTYGSGDNRTTFNLPDLRGRSVVGFEVMGGVTASGRLTNTRPGNLDAQVLGSVGGAQSHTLSPQEAGLNPHSHTHGVSVSWGGGNENGNRCNGGSGGSPGTFPGSSFGLTWGYAFTNDASSDPSSDEHPNLPPLVFLNWVIKY